MSDELKTVQLKKTVINSETGNKEQINVYPVTTTERVVDSNGVNIDTKLAGKIDNPSDKSEGQYLKYNGTGWVADNVFPSSPTAGDAMVYDGSAWSKQDGYGYETTGTITLIDNVTLTGWEQADTYYTIFGATPELKNLVSGQTYIINWGGTNYTCVAFTPQEQIVAIGNTKFFEGTDTGEPFLAFYNSNSLTNRWVSDINSDIAVTVTTTGTIIHQIDSKYIPSDIPSFTITSSQIIGFDPITIQLTDEQYNAALIYSFVNLDTSALGIGNSGIVKFNEDEDQILFASASNARTTWSGTQKFYNEIVTIAKSTKRAVITEGKQDLSSKIDDPDSKSSGQYLKYDGSDWIAANVEAFPTTASAGDAMVYDGTNWSKQDSYGYTVSTKIVDNVTLTGWTAMSSTLYYVTNLTAAMKNISRDYYYAVNWGGTEYICRPIRIVNDSEDIMTMGNLHLYDEDCMDTGEPFMYVVSYSGLEDVWATTSTNDVAVTVNKLDINQIDDKYLNVIPTLDLSESTVVTEHKEYTLTNEQINLISNHSVIEICGFDRGEYLNGQPVLQKYVAIRENRVNDNPSYPMMSFHHISGGDAGIESTAFLINGNNLKIYTVNVTPSSYISNPSTKSSGQYLKYNGTTWVAADVDALPSQTGQSGKYLTTDGSSPSWSNLFIDDDSRLGIGYGVCSTATGIDAKEVTIANYALTKNSIVSIHFDNNVNLNATLNINSTGAKAIFYNSAAIASGVINAGANAILMYDGTNYNLITVDKIASLSHSLNIGTYSYNGSADVTVPVYDGTTSI